MNGLVFALLVAQVGDAATFLAAMPLTGTSVEMGPIGGVYDSLGFLGVVAFKAAIIAAALAALAISGRKYPRAVAGMLVLGTTLATIGMLSNTYALWTLNTIIGGY